MSSIARQRLTASLFALAVGFVLADVASAQGGGNPSAGLIIGEVARCVNGAEQPAAQVNVGIQGGGTSLSQTDPGGQFFLSLPAGQYTVVATAPDGTAIRPNVPVEAGQSLDIGILDIGGGIAGCAPDASIAAPVLATAAPTAVATTAPTTAPTVAPTQQPTVVPITPTIEPTAVPTDAA